MERTSRDARRGIALAEAGAVAAIIALLFILAAASLRRERAAIWDSVDAENLHRFAAATAEYGADNDDKYWTFSWRKAQFEGEALPTEYDDLKYMNDTDHRAAEAQAVDILRRRAGRVDIQPINGWWPHAYYSQLPLYDYLDQEMPALWGVCPADRIRLTWAMDPAAFDKGEFLPCQPAPVNSNKRWPYSSSYELSTSFFDQSEVGSRVFQADGFNLYSVPGDATLIARTVTQTAFPSQKVHLYESAQHHIDEDTPERCETPQRWVVPDSRIAILFTDGHSGLMKTAEANRGWQPNSPLDPDPTCIFVNPEECFPGAYRWTRGYLDGRDFGGPEAGSP